MTDRRNRGAATVEYVALASLVALLVVAAVAALAARAPDRATRELGEVISRRIACAPRYPVPCGRNPLALAYGFPIGKLVRHLAPAATAATGPDGSPLLPVDFRLCRRASCAAPGENGLTAARRRPTIFTSVEDLRRSAGTIRVTYWLYRPTLGWARITRTAGAAEIAASAGIRLGLDDDPVLVPLETLPGRNHVRFPRSEEPPWRWRIESRPATAG